MKGRRIAFAGTPEFAVPTLEAIIARGAHVPLVLTQPDRPAGRGRRMTPPPVKRAAEAHGLRVEQPVHLKDPALPAAWGLDEPPDLLVVVAYGLLLPDWLLAWPRQGCVNVHASLLPRHRGAAPIQWAIAMGDRETGVCLMKMDEGLDTGPVFARRTLAIRDDHDAHSLAEELSKLGAELVRTELPRVVRGELEAVPQPEEGATYARLLEKSDAILDFRRSARALYDHARGMRPWPGAETTLDGERLKILRCVALDESADEAPGEIVRASAEGIDVATGEGILRLLEVQLPGKKPITAAQLVSSRNDLVGRTLGLDADITSA